MYRQKSASLFTALILTASLLLCVFADADENENLAAAHGAAYTAKSTYSATENLAANAFDGDEATCWQAANDDRGDAWLMIELDKAYEIGCAVLKWKSITAAGSATIEASVDGASWTLLASDLGKASAANSSETVYFTKLSAKYVRLNIGGSTDGKYAPELLELELYDREGDAGGDPETSGSAVSAAVAQQSTGDGLSVRFIAAVGTTFTDNVSDDFTLVGFELTVSEPDGDKTDREFSDNVVYEAIGGAGVTADDLGIADGKLFALTVTNVVQNTCFCIVPYAVDYDGNKVYGADGHKRYFTISDGELAMQSKETYLIQQDGGTAVTNDLPLTIKNPLTNTPVPDPEIHRFGDEYWIYTTYGTLNIDAYSSTDNMKTWTLHENIIDMEAFDWATSAIWAPSVLYWDGLYYMTFSANYTASNNKAKYGGIAIGVSDNPAGPFEPLIDGPLVENGWSGYNINVALIDPHLFVDDDDTVYLYFGNGTCCVCKLSPDLKKVVPLDESGVLYREIKLADYCEGPFMIKRNGVYYMMYSCDGFESGKYRVAYATSTDPTKGFVSQGVILGGDGNHVSPGHHSCIYIEEDNLWLICYHRYENGKGNRKGAIEPMFFNEDGSIKPVVLTYGWSTGDLSSIGANSSDLALYASAFDSGHKYYNGNSTVRSINDNIIFSGWQYNDASIRNGVNLSDCWVALDFGEAKTLSSAQIMWESGTRCDADGYTLQISPDGVSWTDIAGQTVSVIESGRVPASPESLKNQITEHEITFDAVTARYLRVNMTKGVSSSYCPKIYELYVY